MSTTTAVPAPFATGRVPITARKLLWLHLIMAIGCSLLIVISLTVSRLNSLEVHGLGTDLTGFILALAMLAPIPAYFHQHGRFASRDSILTIPWLFLMVLICALPFLAGARLRLPLRDDMFSRFDHMLGVDVATIARWSAHHWLGGVINATYRLLWLYLPAAIILPAIFGKSEAKRFMLANLIAIMIGAVLFSLLPAVGPWYSQHFTPTVDQLACERDLLRLRIPQACSFTLVFGCGGIVCFPSFHVIWAILCAAGLWGFKHLRIPLALLSAMIIASTLTTGWHYFIDVLGGVMLAFASLLIAGKLCERY